MNRDEWMKKAPFMGTLLKVLADVLPRYGGDQAAAILSADFRDRMDKIAADTPGLREWLAEMPA